MLVYKVLGLPQRPDHIFTPFFMVCLLWPEGAKQRWVYLWARKDQTPNEGGLYKYTPHLTLGLLTLASFRHYCGIRLSTTRFHIGVHCTFFDICFSRCPSVLLVFLHVHPSWEIWGYCV